MSTLTLILGASDPEMTAIEELGRQVGAEIRYALSARGFAGGYLATHRHMRS